MLALRPASRAGALLIPIVLILAACSSSGASATASAAATGGAGETTATPTPAAPKPPASTAASSQEPSGLPIPSFDISELTKGLSNLESYQVTMTVSGEEVLKSTVVTKPVLARDMTLKGGTRIVTIGTDTWVSQGGAPMTKVPAAMANGLFAAYDPSLLVGAFSGAGWAASSLDQGVEQKNGVSAHHYHVDSTTLVGGFTGLPAGASVDVWIAEDGYLVAFESKGTTGGDYALEVTNVNDPANKVATPS